jgi:hypothetical protein
VLSSLFQNQNKMAPDGFVTMGTLPYATFTPNSRDGAAAKVLTSLVRS